MTIRLRALIVDDERLAREILCERLRRHPQVEVVGTARNAREAAQLIASHRPDVVFLDVEMAGGSGFDLLEELAEPPRIVFVTAYSRYAVRAFDVNALDYLLKPVEPERLAATIARLESQPASVARPVLREDDLVLLDTGHRSCFVPVADLTLIRAEGNYTAVLDRKGHERLVRRTLKDWTETLPPDLFVGLGRSLLLNRRRLREWEVRDRKLRLWVEGLAEPLLLGRAALRQFLTSFTSRA